MTEIELTKKAIVFLKSSKLEVVYATSDGCFFKKQRDAEKWSLKMNLFMVKVSTQSEVIEEKQEPKKRSTKTKK